MVNGVVRRANDEVLADSMRIALTITELNPGGAEKCLVHLACFLAAQGHEVKVWSLGQPPTEGRDGLVQKLEQAHIPWSTGGASSARQFPRVARWLRRELEAFQPEVVQSFLFHANVATAWAVRRLPCRLYGGIRVRQPQRWRGWLQSLAARRMQKMICVSEDVARHTREREGMSAETLVVIPNGIELPQAVTTAAPWVSLGLDQTAKTILFVGRLDPQKGILKLVRHAEQMLQSFPNHRLVLVGEGQERAAIERVLASTSVASRVHLLGWQPDPMVLMQHSEMLVLPAQYEGMPNVVLEAMACRKPVVSFDVDGVRELLGESELADVQLVPPQEYDNLVSAVHRLAGDEELRTRCADANFQRVSEQFSLDQQLEKYLKIYQQKEE